jgi:hypothetical protein
MSTTHENWSSHPVRLHIVLLPVIGVWDYDGARGPGRRVRSAKGAERHGAPQRRSDHDVERWDWESPSIGRG